MRSVESFLKSATRITSDSRHVIPGSIYFAIRGTSVDGHRLIPEALAKGADAIVIDNPEFQTPATILVKNTRESYALASAAWFGHPSKAFHLVGITGTNGKTTCSYLLDQVWRGLGKKTGLIGTVETKVGDSVESSNLTTPGPYELQEIFSKMKTEKVANAVMEVSSIALDQYRTAGSRFEIALFTNFTQDHLDYHGSMEKYLAAKAQFFSEYDIPAVVLNGDDPYAQKLADVANGKVFRYGIGKGADFQLLDYSTTKSGSSAQIRTPTGKVDLRSPLLGLHNIYNCMGVLAVTHLQGENMDRSLQVLESAPGAPGRLERVMYGSKHPNIFVDYAHSDDALKNVLKALRGFRKDGESRLITVFGCGGDRDRLKRPKMGEVVSKMSDITIATSDNPRTEDPKRIIDDIEPGIDKSCTIYLREVDRRKAIRSALEIAKPEDLVLIAGKGHETYQIIGTEKLPFDDREVVREYYL